MKQFMKQNAHLFYVFLLLTASAFAAISCKKDEEVKPSPSLIGKWDLAKEVTVFVYGDDSTKTEKFYGGVGLNQASRILELKADRTLSLVETTETTEGPKESGTLKGKFSYQENNIRWYDLIMTVNISGSKPIPFDPRDGDINKLTLDSLVIKLQMSPDEVSNPPNGVTPDEYFSISHFSVAK